MQKIDRDRLDENTGQIECGEEIGTVFLIDKETAITVKHCLLIEKPETYAKNAVLHFSVKDEEKTVKATVISEDNDSSEDLVVLRCEESIDVQPLYLFSAELDVFDELQMVGYGKSFGFEKRWIQLKNTNLLKKTNKNMILDTIDSAAMDYEGFSGSLIADYNNCIVGIANMQNTEKGKANSLLGISVKNRKKFFENNNIPVYDRAALLNAHCKATKAKAFQNGIDQNVYLKNKQLENDTNSRNIEENTNPLLNMSNVYSEDYNWNIKYTRIEGLLGNTNKRRKERKELTKQWAKEFEQYPGWLIVPADFRQQVKSYGGYMTYEKYNMGNIYGKSLYGIKNRTFRRTGFYEYAKAKRFLDPVSFFEMVRERPYLERLIKAGLYHLAEDIMDNKAQIYCEDSGDLGKALGIDRFRLKRLRTNNGGEIFLQWLLLEKAQNKLIRDDVISWMCREKFKPADLMFIMDRMAPLQIKNYLEKQAAESGESVKDLIKTWKDYLNMAIRVGVNVQDSVIYRARKLMQRHNEMIKEIEAKDLILRAGELEKKYPGLNRICRDLKKYEYADKEYQIVVPEKVDDILYEAKLMHHCVNNTETYYERMSQQESYILFLRKAEQPTEAYYTLEVEPDGTIRQTRTFYNQQNEDIELARDFLVKWQKQLKKKLAKEDYKLAVKSQSLRKKEIDELRSKGVRVNGVGYCNKLLAEILEEDLMEAGNRELEEQAA